MCHPTCGAFGPILALTVIEFGPAKLPPEVVEKRPSLSNSLREGRRRSTLDAKCGVKMSQNSGDT